MRIKGPNCIRVWSVGRTCKVSMGRRFTAGRRVRGSRSCLGEWPVAMDVHQFGKAPEWSEQSRCGFSHLGHGHCDHPVHQQRHHCSHSPTVRTQRGTRSARESALLGSADRHGHLVRVHVPSVNPAQRHHLLHWSHQTQRHGRGGFGLVFHRGGRDYDEHPHLVLRPLPTLRDSTLGHEERHQ